MTTDYPDWSNHATVGELNIANVTGPVDIQNVAGGVVVTGDTMVYLGSLGPLAGPTSSWLKTFAVGHAISAVLVLVMYSATWPPPACVKVAPAAPATTTAQPFFAAPFGAYTTLSVPLRFQAVCPVASQGTGVVDILVLAGTPLPATRTATIYYFGLTASPPLGVRPDGRCLPPGNLFRSASGTAAGQALVPAPPAGVRVLLSAVSMVNLTGLGRITFTGSMRSGGTLLRITGAGQALVTLRPSGLLCAPATPVTVHNSAGSNTSIGLAIYDLIA